MRSSRRTLKDEMSNTDSSDDQALAESKPVTNKGTIGYGEGDSLLQRSLATYRYENALVKTELATALDRHTREVSELKHKYEAQMKDVERQRDILEKRLNDVQDKYTEENRRLQQTNLHLQQCLQSAEGELEAATKSFEAATKEKIQAEEDWQQRLIANQKTVQALKEEKNHLSENVDRLHGELEKERITSREITTTLNAERHQQQLIQSRLSEVEQQCKIQLTSAQTEVSKLREKLEKESAMASKKINELTSSLEEERLAIVRTKERANAKEHELEKRLAEQKQSMLVNSQQQIQQNSSLQERIKGLETTLNHCESKKDTKINDLEIKEQHIMEKLHEAERKKVVLEARVTALESLEGLLRKEREDSSTLRQELHQYRSEGEELQRLNAEFQQQVQNLKNKLAEHEKEKVSIKEEAKKEVGIGQRIMAEQQEAHREELEQLRTRLSSLQTNFNDRNKSYLDECTQLKQKVRTYAKLIKKLRHKLEMGEVHLEQLEAQHEVLKNNVPSDVHRRLQFQLQSITRKHNEFAAFIRGLNEFRSALPEISELTNQLGAVDLKINELEEDQLHCLSELESL